MVECKGGGIYTGIAKDVDARYRQHEAGKGARYTRMNPPIRLLAKAVFPNHSEAAKSEAALKRLTPQEKRRWACALGGA